MADATRDRLLRAATEVFAEKGYASATVREICTRADANVALINYYFGDKLELYTQVLKEVVAADPPRAPGVLGDDPQAALRTIVRTMLERATEAQGGGSMRYRLMMHEFSHPSEATVPMIGITMQPVYDKLRDLVSSIVGLTPAHPTVRLTVHSLLGQVAHFAHSGPVMRALWPEMTMTPEQLKMIAEHISSSTLCFLREESAAARS